jgi:hypothetical protein
VGCSRYKVTDQASGKAWYTEHVEHQPGGAVEFTDGATGKPTMVMSPKIEKVSKKEYDTGIGKK